MFTFRLKIPKTRLHPRPHPRSRSGQSLLETIIAITMIVVGLLGLIQLLGQSLFLNRTVTDETTATYLAVEGIEIAKNLIDHDVYQHLANAGLGWGACFSGYPGAGTTGFEMDYTTSNCGTLTMFAGRSLLYNTSTGRYGYATGVATSFARRILVAQNGNQITVNSIVSWNTGSITSQNINLEDHFYNWHP